MGKEPFVIDTIHPNPLMWSGGVADWDHDEDGRKPVINKMYTSRKEKHGWIKSLANIFGSGGISSVYPYSLQEKNIERISGIGRADIILLKPSTDIPEYSDRDFKNSFYHKYLNPEESQRLKELEDRNEDLEDQLSKKKKDLRKLRDEDDSDSSDEQTKKTYLCSKCSKTASKSDWKDQDKKGEEQCPECGEGDWKNATRVKE